jgi:hypothetical protein
MIILQEAEQPEEALLTATEQPGEQPAELQVGQPVELPEVVQPEAEQPEEALQAEQPVEVLLPAEPMVPRTIIQQVNNRSILANIKSFLIFTGRILII